MARIAVIGAGAWGTALAMVLVRAGGAVGLWARDPALAATINRALENPRRLPGVTLDAAIVATADARAAIAGAEAVLLAVPAQALRATAAILAPAWPGAAPAVICAKGLERESGKLLSAVVAEALAAAPVAVLSGPGFATEVAAGLPCAVTLAAADEAIARGLARTIAGPTFRPYVSTDVIGAQIGGALKNVHAIACGIVDGRGLGESARAALITRALAEMRRFGRALGGRVETLAGLCGLGDLVLSCTSGQLRNYAFGVALGRGRPPAEAAGGRLVEGAATTPAVTARARELGIDMPIADAVEAVIHGGAEVGAEITRLLARPLRDEAP